MRFISRFLALVLLSLPALASELTIKIVDPQGAAVPRAQVELFVENSSRPVAVTTTSPQGVTKFPETPAGILRVYVLAPGFAESWQTLTPGQTIEDNRATIELHLAVATETVVVSATRTPVASDESGASVTTLSAPELNSMRPVAASDALRFLPGAIVDTAGQRGGLSSLFVRGGDSRYNKVIVDGVSVTEPGGTFDFGTLPLTEADRVEFLRGTESTLYGSDAMTSVVQVWTRTGSTPTPDLQFGADAGNYGTENGYASLAGANGRFDYNVFANQFNTSGSGPNDDSSNSLEGANLGTKLNDWASLRLHIRHDNSATGVPGAWNFNGTNFFDIAGTPYTMLPDVYQRAYQNNFLSSLDLTIRTGPQWEHRFTGYEFNLKTYNVDGAGDPGQNTPFGLIDTPFQEFVNINRAGFEYQGNYAERSWARAVVGYEFEDENGSVTSATFPQRVRLNDAVYVEQQVMRGRFSGTVGMRLEHNTTFGNVGVPRVALAYSVLRGGTRFSGTRIRGSFATGIKEPRFEEAYASSPFEIPNPNLKAERNRALEAGLEQSFLSGRVALTATYFNNLFHDQIEFVTIDPTTFVGQYQNLNRSLAHGAEATFDARLTSNISLTSGYTYTSTQILNAPGGFPPFTQGEPLLRRPKHSASSLLIYSGHKWGGDLGGSFVGKRLDSDFDGFGIDHAPGYVLVNAGGWYEINKHITAYINGENLTNHFYEEVTGYPALKLNFRAGMRFRVGGE